LHRVAGTAARVTELALDRGQVALTERVTPADADPRTEVGQVGAGLNSMLSHVATALAAREASETRVRRFVADASHELRTPLAAIRGYAELTRSSPDPVPPDVARALTRIESQADRMSDLVQDLLMLARLDAGRVDDHVQVDLSRLVLEAVDDARAAGDAHHWRLELPDEPVLVRGSQATLRQVVDNLLNNARMHTPPGTTVRTGIRYEPFETRSAPGPATVTLHVTDDGPGIRPELIPDLFERFSRGDTSRSRASGSTGLGLAIVAAIVQAHGGLVFVRSADGTTSFTVRLPAWRPHPYSDAQNRVARGDRQYAPNSH
jgi:two-component system OmpR family sensor kinase